MGIGFHLPFSGNVRKIVEKLRENRANAFQIYSRGLRGIDRQGEVYPLKTVKTRALQEYYDFLDERGIKDMVLHAPYSFHLMGEENEYVTCIEEDLHYAEMLRIPYYVLHAGHQKDWHEYDAVEMVKENLRGILKKTSWSGKILIKNMSGAGTEMPRHIEQWNELLSFHERVKGACDVARLFSFGFNVKESAKQVIEQIEEEVGWEKIEVMYLNDSLVNAGERKNKFVTLGSGVIGIEGMKEFVCSLEMLKQKHWILEYMEDEDLREKDRMLETLLVWKVGGI